MMNSDKVYLSWAFELYSLRENNFRNPGEGGMGVGGRVLPVLAYSTALAKLLICLAEHVR